jgi:hypothetical protein
MLWSSWSSSYIKVWISYQNVTPEVCQKVKKITILTWCDSFQICPILWHFVPHFTIGMLIAWHDFSSDMVFFCWKVLLILKIHWVFRLQFFISSISCQRCIKLATQNYFSEQDRWNGESAYAHKKHVKTYMQISARCSLYIASLRTFFS